MAMFNDSYRWTENFMAWKWGGSCTCILMVYYNNHEFTLYRKIAKNRYKKITHNVMNQ